MADLIMSIAEIIYGMLMIRYNKKMYQGILEFNNSVFKMGLTNAGESIERIFIIVLGIVFLVSGIFDLISLKP